MTVNQKIIFISWTKYSHHTDLLADALGAEVFFIDNFINSRGILWRLFFLVDYFAKGFKSFIIILRTKPAIVFVQNPPSLAPIAVIFFKKIFKIKVVLDSHNGAFEKPWVSIPFHSWALRKADLVTIHNNQLHTNLKDLANFQKVNFKILNSKLADYSGIKKNEQESSHFLIITSFAVDEPVNELLEGIRLFNSNNHTNIKFKITGNYNRNPELFRKYSQERNLEFLGFVSEDDYSDLLVNAYGAMALSTRNDVQQFALMEAVGAEVPFISSDNSTNRSIFNDKMVLTDNTSIKISEAIEKFIKDRDSLYKNILTIKKEQTEKWNRDFNQVKEFLGIIN